MPICLRTVGPSQLSRGLTEYVRNGYGQDSDDEGDLEVGSALDRDKVPMTVANRTLTKAMLQLVSLLRHADDIFSDLSDQCQKISDRTVRINKRIITITENVENLNSKEEPIPSGDLKCFHEGREPFDAKHGYDCNLFTSGTRPQCVRDLYSSAEVSPSVGLSSLDGIRKDGWSGSTMFKLWPVVIKDINISTPDFNMSRKWYLYENVRRVTSRRTPVASEHAPLNFNKCYKTLKEPHRSQTVHSFDQLNFDVDEEDDESTSCYDDQHRLSQSQPSILVSIDTSGAGFERMCLFRRSLRELENSTLSSRCTRRRSISGLPESIMQEIRDFESRKKCSDKVQPRKHPRTYSFNDIGPPNGRDETFAKYFDEIDAKMEEKTEWESLAKQSFFSKFISCNRSRSLPRCARSKYQKIDRGSKLSDRKSVHVDTSEEHFSLDDNLSLTSGSFRRYQKRSSLIGDKIKNFIGGNHRPQRQSLNLDLFKTPLTSHECLDEANFSLAKTLSMPEGIAETQPLKTPQKNNEVKSAQYYNFSNNTLPRAQAKKYDFPWESLPKDWTTSVRLREISKRRKEERQSSSGNWSCSTSARQSLESNRTSCTTPTNEMGGVTSSASFHSLGQDSGRDSATETDDRQTSDTTEGGGDETSTLTGEPSDKDSLSTNFTRLDTVTWFKSLAIRACSQDDTSSSSIDSLSRLTKSDFLTYDLMSSSSAMKASGLLDDEVSSVYSLDQDGFYTSFHSDSGLKRSSMIAGPDIEELAPEYLSEFSIGSSVTVDSVVYIPGSQCTKGSNTDSERDQTTPTREMSACSQRSRSESPTGSEGSDSTLTNVSKRNSLASATTESSYSETDHEIIYKRLRNKTLISPTTFPSWCTVSSSGSDEDVNQLRLQAEFKERQELNKTLKMANIAYKKPSIEYSESSTLDKSAFSRKKLSPKNNSEKKSNIEKKDDDEGSTLPRTYLASKKWNDEETEQTSSWPRMYSSWKENKTQGILKSSFRKESDSGPKMPKSLNFAPYVNMVAPDKTLTQQCLLSPMAGIYCTLPESNSFSSTTCTASNGHSKSSPSKTSAPLTSEDSDLETDSPSNTSGVPVMPEIKSPLTELRKKKMEAIKPTLTYAPYISVPQTHKETELPSSSFLRNKKDSVFVKRPQPLSAKDHPPPNYDSSSDLIKLRNPITVPGKSMSTFSADSTPLNSLATTSISTPYAISQVSQNYGKNSSMSFKISKPVVQKSSDTETVVIDTSKAQAPAEMAPPIYSCIVPAAKKRMSTFLAPDSNPEFTVEPGSITSSASDEGSDKDGLASSGSAANYERMDLARSTSSNMAADMKPSPNNRNKSYRVAVTEETKEEPKRLDSYRKAITLSNKIVEDLPSRSESYRVAMEGCLTNCNSLDDNTNRSDSYRVAIRKNSSEDLSEQVSPGVGATLIKDPRRMGITDIEQLTGSSEDLFKNFNEKSSKPSSLFTKMFGNSKSESPTNKSAPKKSGYKTSSQLQLNKATSPTDKKGRRQSNGKSETGLQDFKKLVAQHSSPASPKVSAVEALKKKPSQPLPKEPAAESGSKKIFGNFFQRPSSWGGTDKVNPKMSTYISFDTIFEDKESISNASSIESLRSPSLNSIKKIGDTENLHLVKINNGLKSDRKSLLEANKHLSAEEIKTSKRRLTSPVDEKAVQSVLDSIKTTIKSMTSRSSDSGYKPQCETGV